MKRWISAVLVPLLLLVPLSACGDKAPTDTQDQRPQVTVALWSDQLTRQYAGYLQTRFPGVDFTFYAATNSTDFYRFKYQQDDLPDILTVRRFALRDVADWKDALLDLSTTELVDSFSQTYLRSYTYEDGVVNWLPTCAEVDGLLVNTDLLARHGLSVPTTYQEFVDLCRELKALGIQPFRSNFSADYTCMEVLQGLSVERLNAQEGREWRQRYESGDTDQLDEALWLPVFQRMAEFINCAGLGEAELTDDFSDMYSAFRRGETAMIRGTPNEAQTNGVADHALFLPYFGATETDNWYLTYPAFQVAAKAVEDPERRQLILDIMAAMLDEEGLQHIAGSEDVIPYNRKVSLSLSPLLENMRPYIYANRLYIRLASSNMFSCSQEVVQGMIAGTYPNARAALDAFNRLMDGEPEEMGETVSIETGYPYAFDPKHGSQAASAVMNTVREEVGTDLLVASAAAVAGNVTAGAYTPAQLRFLTMGESPSLLLCDMTAQQLERYVAYVLTTPGMNASVVNDSTLYVSSGFEMTVRRTESGYELVQLTIDGKALDSAATYTVALLGDMTTMLSGALEAAGVTDYTETETAYKQIVVDRLAGGGQLAQPTDYITLR